jgi:hypothetical protein
MENMSSCYQILPSVKFTYDSGNAKSTIDHILVSDNLKDSLYSCYTVDNITNGSDHLSLMCNFKITIEYMQTPQRASAPKIAWYKASLVDIDMYKANLDVELDKINIPNEVVQCNDIFCKKHSCEIDKLYIDIINCCINASKPLSCTTNNNSNKLTKAGWNDVCKEKKQIALFWHSIWKSAGSPSNGYLANIRRSTRAVYHRSVKILKKDQDKLRSEKLASALVSDPSRNFWNEVKKFRGKSTCIPHNINGTTGDKNIANEFANKFKTIFNSVGCSPQVLSNIQTSVSDILYNTSSSDVNNSLMKPTEMMSIMKDMKSGKSDGNLGLYSDHILNGTDKLFHFISLLFNCMLVHGVSPDDMRLGTMVPIPKGKRLNLGITDNFRGICLQSLLCKVLDLFMLHRERHNLCTSNMQFGFKESLSSSTATAVVTETVDYYQNNGGVVYALALDATKAFDRVEYSQLFKMLMTRNFNPLYTRLLLNMYANQTIRVKFNNEFSEYFPVANGVKQGGILSPTLFTCYVDDMLKRLKSSKIGCHCGNEYLGCVSYADDLILLAPNITALKDMVKTCETFANEYHIKFNGSKCNLLVCDKRNTHHDIDIFVSGEKVTQVNSLKYLGHVLVSDRNDPHIDFIKKDFVMKINSFLGDFGNLSSAIKYDLFRTYCMSLYGTNISDLSNMEPLSVEWRKAVRRILCVPYRTHTRLLSHIVHDIPIDVCLQQRFINFYYSGLYSKNSLVNFMFRNALCKNSRLGKNLTFIMNKIGLLPCRAYNYSPNIICNALVCHWASTCYEPDVCDGFFIKDLILMRDSYGTQFLKDAECRTLIDYLCTRDVS